MSEESRVEAAPQPQGQRLTLHRATCMVVVQLCCVLLLSGCGLYLLSQGGRTPAILCCVGVILNAWLALTYWKQYRRVRAGDTVTIYSRASHQMFRVHPVGAVVVASLITLVVLALGGVTLYILPSLTRIVGIQAFLVGFNLLLWLLTGFLWYRIATERGKVPVGEVVYEQGEGVWPPAPQVPKIK